eukprot:7194805-Heterocapsa_arctica.AAC.1
MHLRVAIVLVRHLRCLPLVVVRLRCLPLLMNSRPGGVEGVPAGQAELLAGVVLRAPLPDWELRALARGAAAAHASE